MEYEYCTGGSEHIFGGWVRRNAMLDEDILCDKVEPTGVSHAMLLT